MTHEELLNDLLAYIEENPSDNLKQSIRDKDLPHMFLDTLADDLLKLLPLIDRTEESQEAIEYYDFLLSAGKENPTELTDILMNNQFVRDFYENATGNQIEEKTEEVEEVESERAESKSDYEVLSEMEREEEEAEDDEEIEEDELEEAEEAEDTLEEAEDSIEDDEELDEEVEEESEEEIENNIVGKITKSKAIEIRKQCFEILKKPNEQITDSEKEILKQYEGAGGLEGEASDENTEEALSEFYTPRLLVKKVWELVDAYAPDAYSVLEPSCGSGRFFEGRSDNEFTAYEKNETSARIAKILYGNVNLTTGDFQRQFLADSGKALKKGLLAKYGITLNEENDKKFDLVIGNPPYGNAMDFYRPFKLYQYNNVDNYQEFFLKTSFAQLKDDGLLAFVVPTDLFNDLVDSYETYDNKTDVFKNNNIADLFVLGELVDRYTLPENIFPSTKIGVDIIILKKNLLDKSLDSIDTTYNQKNYYNCVSKYAYDNFLNQTIRYNVEGYRNRLEKAVKFLEEHPDHILGEQRTRKGRSGDEETYIYSNESLEDILNKIKPIQELVKERTREKREFVANTKPVKRKKIKQIPYIRSIGKELTVKEFCDKYNIPFNELEINVFKNTDFNGRVDLNNLSAKEKEYVLTNNKFSLLQINEKGDKECYYNSLLFSGDIYNKINYISNLYDGSVDDNLGLLDHLLASAPKALTIDRIHFSPLTSFASEFQIPIISLNRKYVDRIIFFLDDSEITDEIREKYKIQDTNDRETLKPDETVLAEDRISQGNFYSWLIDSRERENLSDLRDGDRSVTYSANNKNVKIEDFNKEKFIFHDYEYVDIFFYCIGHNPYKSTLTKEDEKKLYYKDAIAQARKDLKENYNIKVAERKELAEELFDRFLHSNYIPQKVKERLVNEYNQKFNSYIAPKYENLPLFVNGMSSYKGIKEFTLKPVQLRGASFLATKGSGCLAYDVGVGKTAIAIVALVMQLQNGKCKRPLIIVPKSLKTKWYEDIKQLFPSIKVNVIDFIDRNPYYNQDHTLDIEDGSITLITIPTLYNFSFSNDLLNDEKLNQDIADILDINLEQNTQRERAKRIDQLRVVFGSLFSTNDPDNYVLFDKCGFDLIVADEAHKYKNLFRIALDRNHKRASEYASLAGGKASKVALKMYAMTQLIQHENNGSNVFFLTATPFTNSPFEVYSMLAFTSRERLRELGVGSIKDFADKFAVTKYDWGIDSKASTSRILAMKSWRGLSELQNLLSETFDRVSADESNIERPNKKVLPIQLSFTKTQEELMKQQASIISRSTNSYEILTAIANMKKLTFSPYLLVNDIDGVEEDYKSFVESSPKIKFTLNTIIQVHKNSPSSGQVVYMDFAKDYFVYLKEYLIREGGLKKENIAIITGETNEDTRDNITDAFNDENNSLKILIGTRAISEGLDLNGNSIALYNLSLGWNPSEPIQVEGRIWRQGNQQKNVNIVYPLLNNSIDAFIYQKFDEKSSRINTLWDYTGSILNVEDINPEEMKFQLVQDPKEKLKLINNDNAKKVEYEIAMIQVEIKELRKYNSIVNNLTDCNNNIKFHQENADSWASSVSEAEAKVLEKNKEIENTKEVIKSLEKQDSELYEKVIEENKNKLEEKKKELDGLKNDVLWNKEQLKFYCNQVKSETAKREKLLNKLNSKGLETKDDINNKIKELDGRIAELQEKRKEAQKEDAEKLKELEEEYERNKEINKIDVDREVELISNQIIGSIAKADWLVEEEEEENENVNSIESLAGECISNTFADALNENEEEDDIEVIKPETTEINKTNSNSRFNNLEVAEDIGSEEVEKEIKSNGRFSNLETDEIEETEENNRSAEEEKIERLTLISPDNKDNNPKLIPNINEEYEVDGYINIEVSKKLTEDTQAIINTDLNTVIDYIVKKYEGVTNDRIKKEVLKAVEKTFTEKEKTKENKNKNDKKL